MGAVTPFHSFTHSLLSQPFPGVMSASVACFCGSIALDMPVLDFCIDVVAKQAVFLGFTESKFSLIHQLQ